MPWATPRIYLLGIDPALVRSGRSCSDLKMRRLHERYAVTVDEFTDGVVPARQPLVLRGIASSWPLVVAARQHAHRCMNLLSGRADSVPVEILRLEPHHQGRFHYGADGRSLNFVRGRATLATFLAALREQEDEPEPYSLVVQAIPAERYVPGFEQAHPLPVAWAHAKPRLWIGTAAKVATHCDPVDNLAVVAAGRRKFTVFPPDAEPSLYLGPDHPTPAGTPISMVHLTKPDLVHYPEFALALESAQEGELLPGDAIFIPRGWFHHVEALESFNVLVNYWDYSPAPANQ